MIKNEDVIKVFYNGLQCSSKNLSSRFGKLYSYNTCIAQWVGDRVYLNYTKYSTTTSRHQNLVRHICKPYKISCENIPRNITKLDKYINEKI